ncbi:MAG: ABC transporter ATP-binding protein [Planctomycetota bacterium]|nr:ABC transporter ATP-binding protein [Planctomycetota bacterium]
MSVVEIKDLVKHYGKVHALQGVSLSVEKGEIYGLLGRNGAGKTTMIKILLSIVRPTSGEAHLLDFPAGSSELRKRVGYLPEDHRFPDYHTSYSLLDFYGTLYGMPSSERKKKTLEVLEIVDLVEDGHRKIRTYSKGMKQRVGLAQAMLHDPDVYFLDEPTDGVDPIGRKKIREVLKDKFDLRKLIIDVASLIYN